MYSRVSSLSCSEHTVCNSLKQMKLYKVVLVASLFLIIVPLIIHYYLVNVSCTGKYYGESSYSSLLLSLSRSEPSPTLAAAMPIDPGPSWMSTRTIPRLRHPISSYESTKWFGLRWVVLKICSIEIIDFVLFVYYIQLVCKSHQYSNRSGLK